MKQPERILIFELNWLGDILFSFPLIRAIKRALPVAHVACAVVPRYGELIVNNPLIDETIHLHDDRGLFSLWEKASFIRRVRKKRFDACFVMKPSATKTRIAAMAGIPRRIGFAGKNAGLTQEVDMPAGDAHRVDQLLVLASVLGEAGDDNAYEYFVSEENVRKADVFLNNSGGKNRPVTVMNPGGNWDPKRWDRGNFAKLSRRLLDVYPDMEIMVIGAKKDERLAGGIVKEVRDERCRSVAGMTDLNTLAALLKLSALVISADSGPLHLASAVGADTIALFGPTSPKVTAPRGRGNNITIWHDVGCETPCYEPVCGKGYECMKMITVDEVFDAAKQILNNHMVA